MTPIEVFSSQPNCSLPKFIAPRQSGETRSPDRPRFRSPCAAMFENSRVRSQLYVDKDRRASLTPI
jgi:hypothetical protein